MNPRIVAASTRALGTRARVRASSFILLAGLLAPIPGPAAELTVSAAASLSNAFREMGSAFERLTPDAKVLTNFGGSGALLQQILRGAPVDVFASADQETMDQAQAHGLVDASSRQDFTGNRLVVVVPSASTLEISSLADLLDPAVERIAVGLPASVPAGRYARHALEEAGLWPRLAPRTIGTQNVRQALDYVVRGEVDAAFVYASDATMARERVRVAFEVRTKPIRYPIAALASTDEPELARAFVAFVRSPQGQAILARHGFDPP